MPGMTDRREPRREGEPLPLTAPCRKIGLDAPLRWLSLGWRDLRSAPRQSLTYGAIIVALSYLLLLLAWEFGSLGLYLGLASGFLFLGPVLAIGMYSISCQIAMGRKPRLGYCLREGRRHMRNELVFAVVLLVVFLIWARAASMVHVFFPVQSHPAWQDIALFLGVGTTVGALFCAVVFTFSAFSLPMIMDRRIDPVTAVISSANAVLRNKPAMLLWASFIVLSVILGFATALLGFAVLIPLIGHATWHAYKDTIEADAWPAHRPLADTA